MDKGESAERTDLKVRTRDFAIRIVRLFGSLPKTIEAQVWENNSCDRERL